MAMSPMMGGGDEDGGFRPMSEINVTPFVDVMLVLLIVFMVSAPLMMAGVKIDLPKSTAAKLGQPKEPIILTVDAAGQLSIKQETIAPSDLGTRLTDLARGDKNQVIYVRGDTKLQYGKVMEIMGDVSLAGFSKVSLLAEMKPQAATTPAPSATPTVP